MSYSVPRKNGTIKIEDLPDKCPYCHNNILPIPHYSYFNDYFHFWEVYLSCPHSECLRGFQVSYQSEHNSLIFDSYITKGHFESEKFDGKIVKISPSFSKIYNEAFQAEQHGLLEVCGMGYRKALEFLIKDYLENKNPESKETIRAKALGSCINQDITDENIKTVASRATWIGNDETHYVREFEDRDLEDLKNLIKLTVYWINSELLTESYKKEMVKKPKQK